MRQVCGIAVVLTLMATAAHAASLTGALQATAGANGSGDWQINDLSNADYYDLDNDGNVTAGDVILGAFVVDEVQFNGSATVDNVAGIYAIEVSNVVPPGGGSANVSFVPVSNPLAPAGINALINPIAGEMFKLTQGGTATSANSNPAPGSFFNPAYSDGDLYATFTAPGYSINFTSTNLAAIGLLGGGITVGNLAPTNGLVTVANGAGDGGEGIFQINPIVPKLGFDVLVNGTVSTWPSTPSAPAPPSGAAATFRDSAQFFLAGTVIPVPSAGLAGLAMLAAMPLLRRCRRPTPL